LTSFSVTPSSYQVNEGESLTTSLSGFTPGSTHFFKVSGGRGISKKDFAAGGVKGRVQVDANGVATISHTLRADKATEGDESFSIQVFSDKKMRNLLVQSDAVTVFDTSVKAGKGGDKNTNKDPLTGEVIFGSKHGGYDLVTSSGDSKYGRYFLKANTQVAGFDVWGDSNMDKVLGASDPYLGFASADFINSTVMGESGTFATNSQRNTLNIFIGSQKVATFNSGEILL
jgi:hypothetical protein